MTVVRNNFDGGPHGTTLTAVNSGQVPGNTAFNAVSTVSGATVLAFHDAALLGRGTAEFVLKTSTGVTAADNGGMWTTAMGSQTQIWWRQYIQLTMLPTTNGMVNDMVIFECDNGSVYTGIVTIDKDDGTLWVVDADPSTLQANTTTALPLNEWVRLEMRIQFSATVGNWDLQVFLNPESDTPTETLSRTGWDLNAASANSYMFGSGFAKAKKPLTYFSGIELNNTGWPGPAPFRPGRGVPNRNLSNCTAIHTSGE
jgi:hypothetical protein